MQLIRKTIKEELQKVLSLLGEAEFYKDVEVSVPRDSKDNIIYNYEKGRAFAGDNLEADIANLNRYHLVEYLPKSVNEEMWSFEFYTVYGTILIVDIKRIVQGGKSFWSLSMGQLYKGEQNPTLIGEIENINGYDNFVNTVNQRLSIKIDPSRY